MACRQQDNSLKVPVFSDRPRKGSPEQDMECSCNAPVVRWNSMRGMSKISAISAISDEIAFQESRHDSRHDFICPQGAPMACRHDYDRVKFHPPAAAC